MRGLVQEMALAMFRALLPGEEAMAGEIADKLVGKTKDGWDDQGGPTRPPTGGGEGGEATGQLRGRAIPFKAPGERS